MEREILFRGKRLDNGEWVYGAIICQDDRCFINPQTDGTVYCSYSSMSGRWIFGDYLEVDPATVGQYVGMPDKNRTKIFDGDLLKYTRYEDDAPYRVFWDNFEWYIQCENRMPDRLSVSQPENWEVIGNIYDNPELLV